MLTKEAFDKMVEESTNYWGKDYYGRISEGVGYKLFCSLYWEPEGSRDYTVRGVTQCLDWEEPPGHIGPTYQIIKDFNGAKLVQYWWHDLPTVLIDMRPPLEGIYQLYNWMLESGYKVNKF